MIRVNKGEYKREHILVIESYLGRELEKGEVVHHLNGIRKDNRIENLLLMDKGQHDLYHSLCRKYDVDYTKHSKQDVLEILKQVENICRPYTNK